EFFEDDPNRKVEAIVIHFLPDCLGKDFLTLPEAFLLPKLFEKAQKGMRIYGKSRDQLADLMHEATKATDMDRLINLMSMLKILAKTEEYETITSAHAFFKTNESDTLRINKICTYTLSNYKKDISLEEIASIAN